MTVSLSRLRAAMTAAALATSAAAALAQPVPGVRGIDHVGFTVPRIDEGVAFFRDVLGCAEATRFGPFADDKGTFMSDLLDVHPRAVIKTIALMRCGEGSNIELFEYESPDKQRSRPRNSDDAGYHIAFYVADIAAAVNRARQLGLKTGLCPFPVNDGPAAGQAICYVKSPWGMQIELISYPKGMAYEKGASTRLWAPPPR